MSLDVASLQVRPGQSSQFASAFRRASAIIAASPGYIGHELRRCLEVADKNLLLVRRATLEGRTVGFRGSAAYGEWRQLLHHFYEPSPIAEYFTAVAPCGVARLPLCCRPVVLGCGLARGNSSGDEE